MQELSLNVLDIAQNSIAANASVVNIDIEKDTALSQLRLSVRDDGRGMSEEQVQKVTNPFFTTRTTRKVGMGYRCLKWRRR